MTVKEGKLESKIKMLEFLQAIISRMADNSFKIKGWAIAINVSLFTLIIVLVRVDKLENHWILPTIFIISTIILAALDTYYLKLEREFIKKYNKIAVLDVNNFSNEDFKIIPDEEKEPFMIFLSPSILLFYIPILIPAIYLLIYHIRF